MEANITGSVLGTALGLGSAIATEIVEIRKQKQAFAHELAMTKERAKIASAETLQKIQVLNVEADIEEMKKLYEHDIAIGANQSEFMSNLRASVRPVVTYLFFFLFVFLKVVTFCVLLKQAELNLDLIATMWDANTQTLFSSIVTFWFGRRAMEKSYDKPIARRLSGPIT